MHYRNFSYFGTLLFAGAIGCSSPPAEPGQTGSGGTSTGSGGSASGSGGSASGSGGSASGSGGSGSGGSGGDTGSGGASGAGGATGTGGSGNPDGGGSGGTGMDGGGTGGMVAMGCPAGVQGHCSMATYPTYPNFTLALVEDFDAPLNLDTDPVWTYSDGSLDEGQVRMVKNGISFANGRMRLTATREQVAGGQSFAEDKAVPARPLASGELRTKYNNFRYGRYEARFKPPTSNGNFISTMFTFRTPKVIFWREIDIELTASSKVRVGSNIVNANNQGAYPAGNADYQEPMGPAGYDNQADFHVYAFEWLPDRVNWYLNGQMIRTKMAVANIPIPEKSAKIMMNLWIFRGDYAFGGTNGAANVYPMFAEYDWFRFYKLNTENTYPCSPTPTCLTREDLLRSKNNPTDGVADVR